MAVVVDDCTVAEAGEDCGGTAVLDMAADADWLPPAAIVLSGVVVIVEVIVEDATAIDLVVVPATWEVKEAVVLVEGAAIEDDDAEGFDPPPSRPPSPSPPNNPPGEAKGVACTPRLKESVARTARLVRHNITMALTMCKEVFALVKR